MTGQTPEASRSAPAGPRRPAAVDPLDLLLVLGRRRRWLVLWPFLAAVAAAGVSLVLPLGFTAVTRILPPQQSQSTAAAMLSQLGGLAGAAGGALGIKNPSELYLGMLRSTSVADAVIERFKLRERYGTNFLVEAREVLGSSTRLRADKGGIITIEVTADDPGLAADLANAYVAQLHQLTSTLAVTEAAQRRVFFETQLQQSKEKLADAEVNLRQAIDTGGLVSVDAQSRAAVETVARLRAEISAKEIQVGAMRGYATENNPDMRRAEQELSSMRLALSRLESGQGGGAKPAPGDAEIKPATGMGNIRLVREVKYQEVLFELLARQYELARVDESKEAPVVQVLDRAAPPEKRSSPRRTLIVLVTAVAAGLVAALAAFAREALDAAQRDPVRREKLAALRTSWLRRGPGAGPG